MYRVVIGILAILISNTAFALDTEYKNTLTKVELTKASDNSYNVNLYTAKEYQEPVRVIKKSDLNYYILLPETQNATKSMTSGNADIREVTTHLYQYAGSDVKNGYTKVNINTTKPIIFTVNTKTTSNQNVSKQEVKKEETKTAIGETKTQKKNLVQEVKKPEIVPQANKPQIAKQTEKIREQKLTSKQKQNKEPENTSKKPVMAAAKIKENKTETQKNEVPQQKIQETEQDYNMGRDVIEAIVSDQKEQQENLQETNEQEEIKEEVKPEIEEEFQNKTQETVPTKTFGLVALVSKIQSKLSEYGLNLRELFLMSLATMMSFIIVLLVLTRKGETDTRLKSKVDFIDKPSRSNLIANKKMQNQKPNNQYFVFDRNIKQTGLIPPATKGDRNYELSSYAPIKENNLNRVEPYRSKHVASEYDIIQSILKEDSYIDLSNEHIEDKPLRKEYSEDFDTLEDSKSNNMQVQTQTIEKDEPEVLSNVEIAPQRGFMCVSYNNSINLVGYIFDDVFALYNFQQQKLEDYTIRFRLSEKTPNGANFLVKVGKSKMLVNVTKSSMNLEIAM